MGDTLPDWLLTRKRRRRFQSETVQTHLPSAKGTDKQVKGALEYNTPHRCLRDGKRKRRHLSFFSRVAFIRRTQLSPVWLSSAFSFAGFFSLFNGSIPVKTSGSNKEANTLRLINWRGLAQQRVKISAIFSFSLGAAFSRAAQDFQHR